MVEEMKNILTRSLEMEKMAQDNCEAILESLEKNGFHDDIEKIKNHEIRHQEMVAQLLGMLM